jgi:hypothetical protein
MKRFFWTIFFSTIVPSIALAQRPGMGKADEIPVRQMMLSPAGESEPALRWRLLPELRDTTPGNAVQLYYRCFSPEWLTANRRDAQTSEALNNAKSIPLAELRTMAQDANSPIGWLANSSMLKELDRAARRQYCDWDLVSRAREEGLGMLLPDIQAFRLFAPMLAVRARIALANGNFDEAQHVLQTGLGLGRHLSDSPTLIQSLVAAAITQQMLEQVEEWISTPNSPNLYWALSNLPQPFIDLRKAYEGERLLIDNLLPGFRDALIKKTATPMSPADLAALADKLSFLGESREPMIIVTLVIMKAYPHAKEYLHQHGWKDELIAEMPAAQTVLLYQVAMYDRLYEEMVKWYGMPYSLSGPGFARADVSLRREIAQTGSPGMSLAGLLIPATQKVLEAANRVDRKVAALRVIEAIRLYAAEHGRLPARLSEITQVPVPMNPGNGAPFDYSSDGLSGTLLVPGPYPILSIKYQLSIRK